MKLDTKLSIPPQVMSRLVEDETVILDLASGTYFGVDGVAKRIWESIAAGKSLGETASIIAAEFDVSETTARTDVLSFAKELVDRQLLVT